MSGSDAISPTAHYTGYVWARNGLSHPGLVTTEGRVLFESLQPFMAAAGRVGGPSLERYLLARHRAIDRSLEQAIETGAVNQVLEIAAGLSPRGWRFAERYGDAITYVEADLPAMAQRKRRALERIGSLNDHHQVRDVDALKPAGPGSLTELGDELDRDQGLFVITEGLLGYLGRGDVDSLWRRVATLLVAFPTGLYVSDLHLGAAATPGVRAFRLLLAGFVRGRVYLHFDDVAEAEAALRQAGFTRATVTPASGSGRGHRQMAHILEASTNPSEVLP